MEVLVSRVKTMESTKEDAVDFSVLFKSHYPQVARQILSIVGDKMVAEELAQEVFLQLYHAGYREIEHLSAWLYKAALFASFNYLRAERRRRERYGKEIHKENRFSPSSEERWLEREEIAAVQETLIALDERDRLLLLMKYSGYDYREMAQAAGVEKSSVGTLLARAKKKFRELYLKRRGDNE
ncbi:RNA polymerase sigma factor SigX [Bacillaceae bacterium]